MARKSTSIGLLLAGLLVSGGASAQTPVKVSISGGSFDGDVQINNCGCNYAQHWNVPEGAAVVSRAVGPFMTIMDVMGESATHIMLNRGEMEGSDTPWVVHTSMYTHNLTKPEPDFDDALGEFLDYFAGGPVPSFISHPLDPRVLAYNGPGTSRLSVAATYEYFHPLSVGHVFRRRDGSLTGAFEQIVPVSPDDPSCQGATVGGWLSEDETTLFVCQVAGSPLQSWISEGDMWVGENGGVGFLKQRFAPEYVKYARGTTTEINICEGEQGFSAGRALLVRCLPSVGADGTPVTTCWNENAQDETIDCNDLETPPSTDLIADIRNQLRRSEMLGTPIDLPEGIWGDPLANPRYDNSLLQAIRSIESAGRFDPGIDELVNGERTTVRTCKRPSDESARLCYSQRINLGVEAARRTDAYPTQQIPQPALFSGSPNVALNPFYFAREAGTGAWTAHTPNPYTWSAAGGGVMTPYYLKQYVDLGRVNEGYATPGLACSTFLSFLQVQSAQLAAIDNWEGRGYRWDKRFGAVRAKTYPANKVREAAELMHMAIAAITTAKGGDGGFTGIKKDAFAAAAPYAGNMVVNCIVFGPDSHGQCNDSTYRWREFLDSSEGQAFTATSISADWMVGRTSFDGDGNPIGGINQRDSVWSRDAVFSSQGFWANAARTVQYSSEGRVCTCW